MLRCMHPIVDERSNSLILGTMPSTISLSRQEYYANPLNQFWKIVYSIFDRESNLQTNPTYEEKISFLKERRIALWDVIQECERQKSGDVDIKNAVPNNLVGFFSEHPNIKFVYFNGKNAKKIFYRTYPHQLFNGIQLEGLPSSSSAYAAMFLKDKKRIWRIIRTNSELFDPR